MFTWVLLGFQVDGIDALCARLQAAGVPAWSRGGIVQKKDGARAVVVRDPDVGAFVELFEKTQKQSRNFGDRRHNLEIIRGISELAHIR